MRGDVLRSDLDLLQVLAHGCCRLTTLVVNLGQHRMHSNQLIVELEGGTRVALGVGEAVEMEVRLRQAPMRRRTVGVELQTS